MLVQHAVTQSADRANECPHHLDPPLGVICQIYRHSTMRQIKAALKCILTLYRHKKDLFHFPFLNVASHCLEVEMSVDVLDQT